MNKCRYCDLPSLPSICPGHCIYHWAGQLNKPLGVTGAYVPPDMRADYLKELDTYANARIVGSEETGNQGDQMEIQGVKKGDVFVSSWGYEQTNVDFYQVQEDAAYGKFAKLKSLGNKFVKFNESGMCGSVVPNMEIECGEVIKKKVLGQKVGKPAFKVRSCSYAYPWSGNPQHNSWYG